MDNRFIILRHSYDDHSYIDGKNDTSLTENGIKIAEDAAKNIIYKVDNDRIRIRYSTKKRAFETAQIIQDYLEQHNISCELIGDYGLTELFQGTLDFHDMPHMDRVNFLQSCWDDFEYCRLHGDLLHKFGQNKSKDIMLSPGESHNEWAVRIANGLLNIISDLETGAQSINITHRGATFEIQNLIKMVNGLIPSDQVELYKTIRMNYCQDYTLQFENDFEKSKKLIKKYIDKRSGHENNH